MSRLFAIPSKGARQLSGIQFPCYKSRLDIVRQRAFQAIFLCCFESYHNPPPATTAAPAMKRRNQPPVAGQADYALLCAVPRGIVISPVPVSRKRAGSRGTIYDKLAAGREQERGKKMPRRFRCRVCLYVHEGDAPPKRCPLCCVGPDEFEEIDGEGNALVCDKSGECGLWYCSVCNTDCHDGACDEVADDWLCPECGSWKELLRLKK